MKTKMSGGKNKLIALGCILGATTLTATLASGCKFDTGFEHISQGIPATLIPAPQVDIEGMLDIESLIPLEEVEAILADAGLPQWMIDEAMAALGDAAEYDLDAFGQALDDMGVDTDLISDEMKLETIAALEAELEAEANAELPEELGMSVDFDLSAMAAIEVDFANFTESLTDAIYATPISVLVRATLSFQDLTGISPDSIPVLRGVYLEKIGVRTLTSAEASDDTDVIEDQALMGACRDDQSDISWIKNISVVITPVVETGTADSTDLLSYTNTAASSVCSFYADVDEEFNIFESLDQAITLETQLTLTLPVADARVGMFVVGRVDGEVGIPSTIYELMDTGL